MVPAQSFLGRTWRQLARSNNICNIDVVKTQQNNHKNVQAGLLNGTQSGWTAAGPLSLRDNRFASLFLLPSEQGTWQHNSLAAPNPVFPVDSTRKLSQEGRNREHSLYSLLATKEGQFCTEEMCCIFFPLNARPAVLFLSCTPVERALFRKIAGPLQLTTIPISWLVRSQAQMAHNIGNKLSLFLKYGS